MNQLNLEPRPLKTTAAILTLQTLLALSHPTLSHALPKASKSLRSGLNPAQLTAIDTHPALAGSALLADHDNGIVYITPGTRRIQGGSFRVTHTLPACETLRDHYGLTYQVPTRDFRKTALEGPFSPFFDATYGTYVNNATILEQIKKELLAIQKTEEDHQAEKVAYDIAVEQHNAALSEIERIRGAITDLDSAIERARSALSMARTHEERDAAREAYELAVNERRERLPVLEGQLAAARSVETEKRELRYHAQRGWLPYKGDFDSAMAALVRMQKLYEAQKSMAQTSLDYAKKSLQAFESETVGVATASYNLWDSELETLQRIFNQTPEKRLEARRVPILSVSVQTGNSQQTTSTGDLPDDQLISKAPATTEKKGEEIPANPGSSASEKSLETAFRDSKNNPLRIRASLYSAEPAGALTFPVNRAAYCTGDSNFGGSPAPYKDIASDTTLFGPKYRSRASNSIRQNVALNYVYPTKADPMGVSCSLDMKRFSTFARNAGESGFLLWKNSWDDTTRTSLLNNGLTCKTEEAPSWANPEEQRQYLIQLQDYAMKEVMAEYVLSFAKSWTVNLTPEPLKIPAKSAFFSEYGAARQALCKGAPLCEVNSLVWKSLDDLFGSRAGTTSSKDSFNGTISRNFRIDSWFPTPGGAIIEVDIPLN